MTEEERLIKNENIRKAMRETCFKRTKQTCRVFKVKIDESRLSNKQAEQLKMIFVEAKWLYNNILNYSENNDIKDFNYKIKQVAILNKDKEEEIREIKYLGSQMKQSVISSMLSSIKTLATRKKRGYKVGKLKFISNYRSINLKQYEHTYKILSTHLMRIQGISGKIRVNGLEQFIDIPNIEFANAKILNTPKGYYISITTYIDTDSLPIKHFIGKEIGLDMGISTMLTLSNGEKIDVTVEETERLKRLQRKIHKQKKGSNNRRKTCLLIKKEYEKLSNRKNDAANKIVAYILSYENIYMQDEQLIGWKKLFGKKTQHSCLGRIKGKLVHHPRVNVLDRMAPTSKYCANCGNKNKDLTLADRIYVCPICGFQEDRDVHAAKNMIAMTKMIQNNIPRGPRKLTPVETIASDSTDINVELSMVAEAGRLQPLGCD